MTRRPEPEDLLDFRFLEEARISPDGRQVAYVVKTVDKEQNDYLSAIWVAPFEGGPGRRFTWGPGKDGSPAWSPDGAWLAFLSDRASRTEAGQSETKKAREADPAFPERVSQIWLVPVGGGEAHQVTFLYRGAGAPVWSPDGRAIAFAARLGPGDPLDTRETASEVAKPNLHDKWNKDAKVITRIAYKLDGFGFFDEKRSHIFLLRLTEDGQPEGQPVQLTRGDYDHTDPVFSPDGRLVAFTGNRSADPDREPWDRIYVLPVPEPAGADAAGEPVLLAGVKGPAYVPSFSPDSRHLAFLGHEKPHGWYSNDRLWVVRLPEGLVGEQGARGPSQPGAPRPGEPTGEPGAPRLGEPTGEPAEPACRPPDPVCLTPDLDACLGDQAITDMRDHGSPPRPVWTPDGLNLTFLVSDRGTTQLWRMPAAGGRPEPLTSGDRIIYGYSLSADGRRAALSVTDPLEPGDVWALVIEPSPAPDRTATEDGGLPRSATREHRVTSLNAELLAGLTLSPAERWSFTSDGIAMDAWLIRPAGLATSAKCPAVIEVHGGPMGMYGSAFFFEFQLLAAAGYAVVFGNPRGSTSYGEDFCRAIRGNWGDLDYKDVMAETDAALREFPFIDPERLGIAGGSYGGFMTNWVIGHTQRFRAAVSMRSVVSFTSDFGCSDLGYLDDEDFGACPWDDPALYRARSPLTYVTEMNTPVLLINSEEDYRCPISQAEELYTALKKLGRTVEFVRFPGESHGLSRGGKPWHRVFRLEQILRWFEKYLRD